MIRTRECCSDPTIAAYNALRPNMTPRTCSRNGSRSSRTLTPKSFTLFVESLLWEYAGHRVPNCFLVLFSLKEIQVSDFFVSGSYEAFCASFGSLEIEPDHGGMRHRSQIHFPPRPFVGEQDYARTCKWPSRRWLIRGTGAS